MSESLKSLARRIPAFFCPLPEEAELLPSLSLSCMASKRRSRSFQSSLASPWFCRRWAAAVGLAAAAEEGIAMDGSESERDTLLGGTPWASPVEESLLELVALLVPEEESLFAPVLLLLTDARAAAGGGAGGADTRRDWDGWIAVLDLSLIHI